MSVECSGNRENPARRRRFFPRLLLVLLSLVGVFIIAEVVALLALPEVEYSPRLPYHPIVGSTMRPGMRLSCNDEKGTYEYKVNSLGFRGEEWRDRQPGLRRLVVVGDSFVNAWGARDEDSIQMRAAERASRRTGRPWEGIGLGADDWGTAQEWLALQTWGKQLAPDVVVLAFYPGNDLANNTPGLAGKTIVGATDITRPYFVVDGSGELESYSIRPFLGFLRRYSLLVRTFERTFLTWKTPNHLLESRDSPEERIKIGKPPYRHWEVYLRTLQMEWEEAWKITERLILACKNEADALGARFIFLLLPMWETVQYDSRSVCVERTFQIFHGTEIRLGELLDWNAPAFRLRELACREGLEFLDLTPVLRRAARERSRCLYQWDGHLSGEGYRLAGEALGDFLAGDTPLLRLEDEPDPVEVLPSPGLDFDVSSGPPSWFPGHGFHQWTDGTITASPGAMLLMHRPPEGSRLRVEGYVPKGFPLPLELTFAVDHVQTGKIVIRSHELFTFVSEKRVHCPPGRWAVLTFNVYGVSKELVHKIEFRIRRVLLEK